MIDTEKLLKHLENEIAKAKINSVMDEYRGARSAYESIRDDIIAGKFDNEVTS